MRLQWMLPAMLSLLLPPLGHAAALPVWSVDPSTPGADLPAAGTSLFDAVTTAQGRQSIPFPFEKLVAGLEAAAGCGQRKACARAVLLPLGRSLQRVAASPDFFAHPRVVLGFVADGQGRLLRDRLYLGYQDKAGVIEVISYNEAAGRFEFQIVRNYFAGRTPQVNYARRAVCVSCHQNHGPIFSRQVWLETNANPQIAALLAEHAADSPAGPERPAKFHGVAARGSLDIANALDDATDRSNRLALVQKLWLEGCGAGAPGEKCRHGVFVAALQFALTAGRAHDSNGSFQRDVADRLHAVAQQRWPAGISIPDADIVNRDPLAGNDAAAAGPTLAHVPARFDPLVPRAPAEIVAAEGKVLAAELVRGIAGFVSSARRDALERALAQNAKRQSLRELKVACAVAETGSRVAFDCQQARACAHEDCESATAPSTHLVLQGTVERDAGTLDMVEVEGIAIRHLGISSAALRSDPAGRALSFDVHDQGRTARLPDGNAISSIVVKWRTAPPARAEATLTVRQDFAAVAELAYTAPGPFRTSALDDFVTRIRAGEKHGAHEHGFQAVVAEASPPEAQSAGRTRNDMDGEAASAKVGLAGPAIVFGPDCGNCHGTDEITPPNFLSGDARRVSAALNSCAPRMLVRLAMQEVPVAERDKSPMPPEPVLLPGQQPPAADLRKSASLMAVRRAVEERLRAEYGRVPSVAELLQNGYENLPPCLPGPG